MRSGFTVVRAMTFMPCPRLTARPAKLLGIEAGRLTKGLSADLCLFHPDRVWRVEAGRLPGKAQNTPFDGRALEGVVLGTWKAGRRVFG